MYYILDGSGFLFRAYYSLPKILDKNWNESWAIFWFFRMLLKLLHDKPDHFIIVFDPWTKTVREEEFKNYKANRPEIDEWFKQQIPKIIDILKKTGFDVEIIPEYEADDTIASLVDSLKNQNKKVVVVSSDKDLKQLISKNVEFLEPKKMEFIDEKKFKEEFGFSPKWMLLYLALLWDSSDNIPWIKWIWKKTAAEIVSSYETFDDLIKNLDLLPEKIKNKIKPNIQQLEENIKLIKLRIPKKFDTKEIEKKSNVKNINWDLLKNILVKEYWFKSFENLIDKAKKEISQPTQLGLF